MVIIVGLALGLAALYFWLSAAHGFARVLAFLFFAALFGLPGALLTASPMSAPGNGAFIGLALGVALAWFASGIPTYVRRARSMPFNEPVSLTLR